MVQHGYHFRIVFPAVQQAAVPVYPLHILYGHENNAHQVSAVMLSFAGQQRGSVCICVCGIRMHAVTDDGLPHFCDWIIVTEPDAVDLPYFMVFLFGTQLRCHGQ